MIYKNLSVTADGGIVPDFQLVEDNGHANIIIGLGGTGINCLREIKKQVYNRIKPDNATSDAPTAPEYRHIQFLAIDTDDMSVNDDYSCAAVDRENEFIYIGCDNVYHYLNDPRIRLINPSLQWLSDQISINFSNSGAGAVRQLGRLLMMLKSDTIKTVIIRKIQTAQFGLQNANVNIHILTGLGGGTGSGIFLDICYIVRHILKQLALRSWATVFGYFFLPDVDAQRIPLSSVKKIIEINGYAALKELDYCMSFDKNGGKWDQVYGNYRIVSEQAPVDNAHLISALDINGDIKIDGYNNAIKTAADYVTESLTLSFQSFGGGHAAHPFPKKSGACYNYLAIGGARAFVPYKDFYVYLLAKVFEAYRALSKVNNDIRDFAEYNHLTYKELLHMLQISDDAAVLAVLEESKNAAMTDYYSLLSKMQALPSKMQEGMSRFKEELSIKSSKVEQSVIYSIRRELIETAASKEKGAVYASSILRNPNSPDMSLDAVLQGYKLQNADAQALESYNLQKMEQRVDESLRELQSKRLGRKRITEEYLSAVFYYRKCLERIAIYEQMDAFLSRLDTEIQNLYKTVFAPVNAVLANVAETVFLDYSFLNETVDTGDRYAQKIISLADPELKRILDSAVESIDTAKVIGDFTRYLIINCGISAYRYDDQKIGFYVSHFFAKRFDSIIRRDIDYYLRERFGTEDPNQLADITYRRIMTRLNNKAKPLFWANQMYHQRSSFGYCIIPEYSEVLSEAARRISRQCPELSIIRNERYDSIALFMLDYRIPMYTYREILSCKEKYDQCKATGLHIYEGTKGDPRNFRNLRSVIPLSVYSEAELEKVKDFADDYAEAVKNGIIYKESGGAFNNCEYRLGIVDDEELSAKLKSIGEVLANGSAEEAAKFLDDDRNTRAGFKTYIDLPGDGMQEYSDYVVRDYVFASEYYTSILREQLEKTEKLNSAVQRLKERAAD